MGGGGCVGDRRAGERWLAGEMISISGVHRQGEFFWPAPGRNTNREPMGDPPGLIDRAGMAGAEQDRQRRRCASVHIWNLYFLRAKPAATIGFTSEVLKLLQMTRLRL